MRVKVCGIMRLEDAQLASELGAWAIGFVFWPGSPRCVDARAAKAIADRLPPGVERVGVFADQPRAHVTAVAALVGLDAIQLHGQESPAYARCLGRPVIKALSPERARREDASGEWGDALIMLDARDPTRLAAGGRTLDWTAAAPIAARRPVVLAGGLTAANVAEAIRVVRPHAVDVSSGVERAAGEKDADRLRAFFAAVAAAERTGDEAVR